MKKITFLIILITGFFITPVQADISSGGYVGLSYAKLGAEILVPDDSIAGGASQTRKIDPTIDNFIFRVGYYFASFMAGEVHLGSSLTEEGGNGTSEIKTTNLVSAFVRFNVPLHANNTNVYLLLGGTRSEIDIDEQPFGTNLTGKTKATTTGPSYIFGVELYSTPITALTLEYARYHLEDEVKYGGLSIGVVSHFNVNNILK